MRCRLEVPGNTQETVLWIKNRFQNYVETILSQKNTVRLAISGGSTPLPLYKQFQEDHQWPFWSRIDWFWNDERCVPLSDSESNYGNSLPFLESISYSSLHPMFTEGISPVIAAEQYARTIVAHLPLDLVLLGVGKDGHVASLFPGHPVFLRQKTALLRNEQTSIPLVESFDVPGKGLRISLSLRVLLEAKNIWVIVFGKDKSNVLAASLQNLDDSLPITLFTQKSNVLFIADKDAANHFEQRS